MSASHSAYTVILEGFEPSDPGMPHPTERLKAVLNVDDATARLLFANSPAILKRTATEEEAHRYEAALTAIGARICLKPVPDLSKTLSEPPDSIAGDRDPTSSTGDETVKELRLDGAVTAAAASLFGRAGVAASIPKMETSAALLDLLDDAPVSEPPLPLGPEHLEPLPENPADAGEPRGELECPRCGRKQPPSETCYRCGIIFAKFAREVPKRPESGNARGSAPKLRALDPPSDASRGGDAGEGARFWDRLRRR